MNMDGIELKSMPLLMKDPALSANFLEALHRGTADIIYDTENVLLVNIKDSSVFFHIGGGAEGREALKLVFSDEDGVSLVVAHDLEIREYLMAEMGYKNDRGCYQAVYEGDKIQVDSQLTFHTPAEEDFELFRSTYGIGDDEMKRELFNSPEFMGGYINDENGNEVMAGYVGEHLEGSIGMLYVFPEFRKRGLAYEMQAFMINRAIDKGSIPFGQIYEDNAASLALSHKMGLTFSRSKLYWLWKF